MQPTLMTNKNWRSPWGSTLYHIIFEIQVYIYINKSHMEDAQDTCVPHISGRRLMNS